MPVFLVLLALGLEGGLFPGFYYICSRAICQTFSTCGSLDITHHSSKQGIQQGIGALGEEGIKDHDPTSTTWGLLGAQTPNESPGCHGVCVKWLGQGFGSLTCLWIFRLFRRAWGLNVGFQTADEGLYRAYARLHEPTWGFGVVALQQLYQYYGPIFSLS